MGSHHGQFTTKAHKFALKITYVRKYSVSKKEKDHKNAITFNFIELVSIIYCVLGKSIHFEANGKVDKNKHDKSRW